MGPVGRLAAKGDGLPREAITLVAVCGPPWGVPGAEAVCVAWRGAVCGVGLGGGVRDGEDVGEGFG